MNQAKETNINLLPIINTSLQIPCLYREIQPWTMNNEIKGKGHIGKEKLQENKDRVNMDILPPSSKFQVQQIKAAKPLSTI